VARGPSLLVALEREGADDLDARSAELRGPRGELADRTRRARRLALRDLELEAGVDVALGGADGALEGRDARPARLEPDGEVRARGSDRRVRRDDAVRLRAERARGDASLVEL